jgi:UrcA family protein
MPISLTRAALVLGLSCTLAATPAFAAPDGQSTVVRFTDLNLATPAGEQVLYRRVSQAAKLVCGEADLRDLQRMSEMTACRATAMASAAPQMQLAIANAHNGMAYATAKLKVTSSPS